MIDYRKDNIWSVYIHTSPSGKYYVGITSKSPKARWGKNGCGYKSQPFFNAIKKYGWKNFEHEIIAEHLTEKEAKDMEITLIRKLCSHGENGYNCTLGGDGTTAVNRIDITNQRYGKLVALKPDYSNPRATKWLCKCDCGNERYVLLSSLRGGTTKSCGCIGDKRYVKNNYTFLEDYVILHCNNNTNVKIDYELYDKIKDNNWRVHKGETLIFTKDYSLRENQDTYLHQILFQKENPYYLRIKLGFKNGDSFDYRKDNIYIKTPNNASYEDYIYYLQNNLMGYITFKKNGHVTVIKKYTDKNNKKKTKTRDFKNIKQAHDFVINEYENWSVYRSGHGKPVICLNTGQVFETSMSAFRTLGISNEYILDKCNGKHSYKIYHKGEVLRWRFYDDYVADGGKPIDEKDIIH